MNHKKKEDIAAAALELSGGAPGSKLFMGVYQKAVDQVWKGLSKEEQEEMKQTAEEWNNRAPPADVQAK